MEIWGGNQAIDNAISVAGMDAWVFSQPYAGASAGGDIHYISMCGGAKICRFVVADVSGHGAAVADLADRLRRLMRENINTLDQTRFVRALNEQFACQAEAGLFASALLATYFAPTDDLLICNAGHPKPYLYRAARKSWMPLDPATPERVEHLANLPLGVIVPTDYFQFAVHLEVGDLILMYTDALPEAADPQGQLLGDAGLRTLLEQQDASRPEELCRSLSLALERYRGAAPPDDDLTLVLLHHNAAPHARLGMMEMARVVGKMVGIIKV